MHRQLKPKSEPEIDQLNAVLSLRWLLVILASYLTLFSYLGRERFPFVAGAAVAFALSNVALMLVPRSRFTGRKVQAATDIMDAVFVSTTLFLLRIPDNQLHLGFIAIFLLAVFWRDLRLVLLSLLIVSVLFGVFHYFSLFRLEFAVNIEQFLTLSLLFVVSVFYIFLSDRLTQEARMSSAMMEESRISEVMVEMTRALSSSLKTDDVLYSIVSRLREVLDADDCSIVRIDPKSGSAKVMVKASQPGERDVPIELDEHPI